MKLTIKYLFFLSLVLYSCNIPYEKEGLEQASEEIDISEDESQNRSYKEGSFLSFFQKFSESKEFQFTRIVFPLNYRSFDIEMDALKNSLIQKSEWQFIDFTADKKANESKLDRFEGVLEKINSVKYKYTRKGFDNGIFIEYEFDLIKGDWFLVGINDLSI